MDASEEELNAQSKGEVLSEAQGLEWKDTFFDTEEGLVAVFDYDYPLIESFKTKHATANLLVNLLLLPNFIFGLIICYPCFYKQQIQWDTYSKHVAVTHDGIKFVQDKRKTLCGFSCSDAGRISKTIPIDKITDCDVTEPAGATCLCIDNVLSTVNIDTASSGGGAMHELVLSGLKEPLKFKKLIWAMKRAHVSVPDSAPEAEVMDREVKNEDTNTILRDIRNELHELNAHKK